MKLSKKKLSTEMLREFCAVASAVGLLDLDDALTDQAKKGNTSVVRALIKGGADVHTSKDWALRVAAEAGHTKTVQALLAAGADVHADNNVALMLAAQNGHASTLKTLLKAGADVHARGDDALMYAAKHGCADAVRVLLESGAGGLSRAFREAPRPGGFSHGRTPEERYRQEERFRQECKTIKLLREAMQSARASLG